MRRSHKLTRMCRAVCGAAPVHYLRKKTAQKRSDLLSGSASHPCSLGWRLLITGIVTYKRANQDMWSVYHAMKRFAFGGGIMTTRVVTAGCIVVGSDNKSIHQVPIDLKNERLSLEKNGLFSENRG